MKNSAVNRINQIFQLPLKMFLFIDLNTSFAPLSMSARHGSYIKQLSVAIGMARKKSYSFFG